MTDQTAALLAILHKRVSMMSWVSALLLPCILLITLGFVVGVLAFEFKFAKEQPVTNSLRDATYDAQEAIVHSERNIRNVVENLDVPTDVKERLINGNLDASTRAIRVFTAKIGALQDEAAAADDKLTSAFLTSKRVLVALAGLFVAIVVKLLIELYKYNAHLRSHYLAVADALLICGDKFNQNSLERLIPVFSPPSLRIGRVKSIQDLLDVSASSASKDGDRKI